MTPEAHHTLLIEAIERELDLYGPQSLADVCLTLIENRTDEDEPKPSDAFWLKAAAAFAAAVEATPSGTGH